MKLKNYQTSRYNDFWGWMNVRDSADSIEDKQGVFLKNFQWEGNKLVTMKGYEPITSHWGKQIQWIASWSKYVIYIHNLTLYVYDTNTNSSIASISVTWWADTIFNISVGKILSTWICISDSKWIYDTQLFKLDWTTLTSQAFTSLTNKKFTCNAFMGNRLWLGWNNLAPSTLYTSQQASPLTESNIYNFTYWNWISSTIDLIWDVNPITWFIDNNWDYYIFKTNGSYNVIDIISPTTTSSAAIRTKKVTSTWAINQQVIQNVDQDVLYFDGRNVRRLSYEQNTLALKDSSVSTEISTFINELPEIQSQATAWFVYPYYKLFVRDRFSNTNNIWLIYNIREKSWSIQQWIFPSVWASSYWNEKRVAYFWSWVYWDIFKESLWLSFWWGDVNYLFISKKYAFWDNLDYKRLWEIELYGKISSWLKLYLDIILDDAVIDTREIYFEEFISPTLWSSTIWVSTFGWVETTNQLNNFRYRYEYFNDWVFIQFRIRWTWVWYFELHWVNIESKFIKAYPIHY